MVLWGKNRQFEEIIAAQQRNHEFIVTVVESLENRIMEMQASQIRWIEMYENKLEELGRK